MLEWGSLITVSLSHHPTVRNSQCLLQRILICCVQISSFAVDESVGWLVQASLTLFAFTGSARLWKV